MARDAMYQPQYKYWCSCIKDENVSIFVFFFLVFFVLHGITRNLSQFFYRKGFYILLVVLFFFSVPTELKVQLRALIKLNQKLSRGIICFYIFAQNCSFENLCVCERCVLQKVSISSIRAWIRSRPPFYYTGKKLWDSAIKARNNNVIISYIITFPIYEMTSRFLAHA